MKKRWAAIVLCLLFTGLTPVRIEAYPELIDMDVSLMENSEIWEMFPSHARASYVVIKFSKDIQDWYQIDEEEQLQLDDFILYTRSPSKKYNKVASFCLYPYDRNVYINIEKISRVDKYTPGSLYAIGVLAHELCHIKQMKEGRLSNDKDVVMQSDIEASTNAANYLYYLTGNKYPVGSYMPVSDEFVHTY